MCSASRLPQPCKGRKTMAAQYNEITEIDSRLKHYQRNIAGVVILRWAMHIGVLVCAAVQAAMQTKPWVQLFGQDSTFTSGVAVLAALLTAVFTGVNLAGKFSERRKNILIKIRTLTLTLIVRNADLSKKNKIIDVLTTMDTS